ncbi:MAG: hypothetical protein R6V13_01940 [Anaerolineae bacterium]
MTWRDHYYHRTDWPEAASWRKELSKKEQPPIDPDVERPGPEAEEELVGLDGKKIPVQGLDEE